MAGSLAPLLTVCEATPALTLATVSPDGAPAAASLFFAYDENLHLYFLSAEHTQHVQNLLHDPRVAVTIAPPAQHWQEIRGLQLRGTAHMLTNAAAEARARAIYAARFPFIGSFGQMLTQMRWFKIVPHWARLTDNRIAFAHKQEWVFDDDGFAPL